MIQRIFIGLALLLAASFFGCLFWLNQPAPVPLPAIAPPVDKGLSEPAPVAAAKSVAEYAAILGKVRLASQRYMETRQHPFQVDRQQQDGGLNSGLLVPFGGGPLEHDAAVFWRLVSGDGQVVLCAQFMVPSQALEISTPLSEAARQQGMLVELQACGESALGVKLTAPAPSKGLDLAAPPPLPPLPSIPNLTGGSPAGPEARKGACEDTTAIDERLSRLL